MFRYLAIGIILSFIFFSSAVSAFCFKEAGNMYGISPALLRAIAKVESDLQPDAVNFNANGSYDLGLMQLNSWWAQKVSIELWDEASNACTNVKLGAWILARCVHRHEYTWKAVGCYHSPRKKRQSVYISRIRQVLIGNDAN